MKIEEIKNIIDKKQYKSYKLGDNEYYILFNKDYDTYISYIGVFETITFKINKPFKVFRLGLYYNSKEYIEKISSYHVNDKFLKKVYPDDLYQIISGKKIDFFYQKSIDEINQYNKNESILFYDLISSIRKNKLKKIINSKYNI